MSERAGPFWAYIIENADGRFYVGHTDCLERRIEEHNDLTSTKSKYTIKNGPWKLRWSEPHGSRSEAMAREKQIKSMKSARWIRENLLDW